MGKELACLHTIGNVVDHQSKLTCEMWVVDLLLEPTHTHHQHDNIMGLKTMDVCWDEDFTHFDQIDKASLLDSNA